MTARELRNHLRDRHDIPTRGLMYDQMLTLHDYDHRPANAQDHDHADGPDTAQWARDCADFGCDERGH